MAEERGGLGGIILERVALFKMILVGAEEVQKVIKVTDAEMMKYARHLQETKKEVVELSRAFRELGFSISTTQLQQLPQATRFLFQYGRAMEALPEHLEEVSAGEWALTEAGQQAAVSTGLVTEGMIRAGQAARGLRQRFWDLNATARALLRIFVAFKILTGMLGFFRDIAEASAKLQAELWRLGVTVRATSDEIGGGAEDWEEWISRIERLREALPFVSMVEIVEGMRKTVALLGPLGLTADEMERLLELIGQMSLIAGQDFIPFVNQIINAFTGMGRNIVSLNINLKEGSKGLEDYAEEAGFTWDEIDTLTKQYIRMAYFVSEATKRSEEVRDAEEEEWLQLQNLRKEREDILAKSPELIKAQKLWAEILLETAKVIERIVGAIADWTETDLFPWLDEAIKKTGAFLAVLRAIAGMEPGEVTYEEFWESFAEQLKFQEVLDWLERLKEPWQEIAEEARRAGGDLEESILGQAEAAEKAAKTAEDAGSRISRAWRQAQSAVRSYERAVIQAGVRLERRLADIAENLERRLADLEARFETRRSQLIARFDERRADLRAEQAQREEDLRRDLNQRLQRMEEDHQLDMLELREDYLLDLGEAARKRDAVSMRRIQQRYILEKRQRERDYGVNRRRAKEDYEQQLADLRRAFEERERELQKALERQLRELMENYVRQQEEAKQNAERQQEDAREDYEQRLIDLNTNLQDRLMDIGNALMEEEELWQDHYDDLLELFDEFYEGQLEGWDAWIEDMQTRLAEAQFVIAGTTSFPGVPPFPQAGVGIATTELIVGERGMAIPASFGGMRLPSQAIDIRLTIDGEQSGLWSADFETQVVRVLHGVLEEAGL